MKKSLLIVAAMLYFGYANAQMKLGTNPTTTNSNALLEMETTNKGLLLPRVALTSTTSFAPLTAHVAGMAVYNTATAGDVAPGYYVDNGTKWVKLSDASALQLTTGAAVGKVLTSDAAGNATWQTPTTSGLSSVAFLSLSASDGGGIPNILWDQTLMNGSPTNITPNGGTGVIALTQGTYMVSINLITFGYANGAYASVGLFNEGTNAEVYAGKSCLAVNLNSGYQASSNYTWTIVVPAGGGSYSLRRTGGTNCRFETASSLGITKLN